MDDMKISLSVPATIYSFGETKNLTSNQYVTPAKLKVFYVGQTPDKRVFTKQFSDQLLQTLPGTPVVAYYDEERDDFIGHNYIQYIFGYVPETATIVYLEENGVTYALTDVVLFTGREDNIGFVATKIIGHAHSLELDPKTVEYTIVRAKNTIESITFNKGHFIGLSVLGNNEKPAFNGSSFFTEDAEIKSFVNSFNEFKREVELYKSGGHEMQNENTLPPISEPEVIVNATTTEPEVEINDAAQAQEICVTVVVEVETEEASQQTPEEIPTETPEMPMDSTLDYVEKPMDEDMPPEDPYEDPKEDKEDEEEMALKDEEVNCEVHIEQVVEAQVLKGTEEDVRKQKQEEDSQVAEKIANATALNDAERQELNEYRKKAKFELIDSYNDLADSIKDQFRNTYANYTLESLDKELAYALVKTQRQYKNTGVRVFTIIPTETQKEDTLADVINRYKDKH